MQTSPLLLRISGPSGILGSSLSTACLIGMDNSPLPTQQPLHGLVTCYASRQGDQAASIVAEAPGAALLKLLLQLPLLHMLLLIMLGISHCLRRQEGHGLQQF